MTKRLSNTQKVFNLQRKIECVCHTFTNVLVTYDEKFREIVLEGDGFLAVKGIMSEDGKHVKITKCPESEKYNRTGKRTDEESPDRYPLIRDWYVCRPISFQKFSNICKRYKSAWQSKIFTLT